MRKAAVLVAILTATSAWGASQTSDTSSAAPPKGDRSVQASPARKHTSRSAAAGTGSAQSAGNEAGASAQDTAKAERDQLSKDDFSLKGKVGKVSARSVTVDRDGSTPATLEVVRATKIEVDGKAAQLSDVKSGDDVKASFNLRGARPIAVELKASSKK